MRYSSWLIAIAASAGAVPLYPSTAHLNEINPALGLPSEVNQYAAGPAKKLNKRIVTIATNIGLGLGPVLTGAVQTGLNSAASNKVKDALNGALSALKDLAKGEAPPKGAKSDKESTAALVAALNSAVDKPDGFLAQKGGEKLGKALGETIGRFATYGTNPFKAG